MQPKPPKCLICNTEKTSWVPVKEGDDRYAFCTECDFHFLNPQYRLNAADEESRYRHHKNDENDLAYQEFVRPLFEKLKLEIPPGCQGLDFGAGASSSMAHLMIEAGFQVKLYDPYFHQDPDIFKHQYDFVYACEVVEHLFDPVHEFKKIRTLLPENGIFAFMTLLYHSGLKFDDWYYRKDPTHVGFFSAQTCDLISTRCGFELINQSQLADRKNRVVLFRAV